MMTSKQEHPPKHKNKKKQKGRINQQTSTAEQTSRKKQLKNVQASSQICFQRRQNNNKHHAEKGRAKHYCCLCGNVTLIK